MAHIVKINNFRGILGKSRNPEFYKMLKFHNFNFDLKFLLNWSFFQYEPKVLDLKKVFSNLELEAQGRGITMGVTHQLLLGPFYYIALYWGIKIKTHTV